MNRRGSVVARTDDAEGLASWADLLAALDQKTPRVGDSLISKACQQLVRLGLPSPSRAPAAGGPGGGQQVYRPWVIYHTSSAWTTFHAMFIFFTVWDALLLPVFLVDTELLDKAQPWIWPVFCFLDVVYFIRVAFHFRESFTNSNSAIVDEPNLIRLHYFAGEFVFDLIASWPHDLVALVLGTPSITAMELRLIKLLNVRYTLHAYSAYI
ncbi:hypothetical protein T492DRAFT_105504 [Pavlovales sp. CCMP2436]|nr:hypothetical protein T492DRAFT_105504 [Pavlovales sp. CCMP2436]